MNISEKCKGLTIQEVAELSYQEGDLFGFDELGWEKYSRDLARRFREMNDNYPLGE